MEKTLPDSRIREALDLTAARDTIAHGRGDSMKETTQKLIVAAMVEVGGGHKSPAVALDEALRLVYPGRFRTRVMDFMSDLGCRKLDEHHKRTWTFLLAHPILAWVAWAAGTLGGGLTRAALRRYVKPLVPYVREWMERERPNVIVSTHYLNTIALCAARRASRVPVTLVQLATELYDLQAFWAVKDVEHSIVCSEKARRMLVHRGVPVTKVHVFPYPLRPGFTSVRRDAAAVKAQMGIANGRRTALVSFGTEGIGGAAKYVQALIASRLPMNVVVVTGHNGHLSEELERRHARNVRGDQPPLLRILGWVEEMNELIAASDICLVKPGPSSMMESVGFQKPMVFSRPVNFSEAQNVQVARRFGVGFATNGSGRRLVKIMRTLLDDRAYNAVVDRYRSLAPADGARALAGFVERLASGGTESTADEGVPAADAWTQRRAEAVLPGYLALH